MFPTVHYSRLKLCIS